MRERVATNETLPGEFAGHLAVLLGLTALLVLPLTGNAQGHAGHEPQSGYSASAMGIITESTPANDAILAMAPERLRLNFDRHVRLVKLVLHNDQHDWVDIGFRYDPRHDDQFAWSIPLLRETDFYTADWAILDDQDRLIRGSFSFTFGSDREAPSSVMARLMLMREALDSSLLEMPSDPAEIIINNREHPPFEEPFAPVLNRPGQ